MLRCVGLLFAFATLAAGPPRALDAEGLGRQVRRGAARDLAAGKLLVAARNLPDANFAGTVILLVDFSRQGAMGLIVNRPTKVTLSRMLPGLEQSPGGAATAFVGGPVSPSAVLALLRSTSPCSACRHVVGDVHLVNTRAGLTEQIAAGLGPDRFRVYVGYAGWGGGQLEEETVEGAWHVLDADAAVVFDPNPGSAWQRQIKRTEVLSASAVHRARDTDLAP